MTVSTWIRTRRLEQCRRDLLDPMLADRPVAAIAARWGFVDAAHFSRAFKTAFGVSPASTAPPTDPVVPVLPVARGIKTAPPALASRTFLIPHLHPRPCAGSRTHLTPVGQGHFRPRTDERHSVRGRAAPPQRARLPHPRGHDSRAPEDTTPACGIRNTPHTRPAGTFSVPQRGGRWRGAGAGSGTHSTHVRQGRFRPRTDERHAVRGRARLPRARGRRARVRDQEGTPLASGRGGFDPARGPGADPGRNRGTELRGADLPGRARRLTLGAGWTPRA